MTNEELEHKAIRLIQSTCKDRGVVEVCYSGGKDSDVILQLVRDSGVPYRAIYKNTTIDPAGTIKHCKEKGVEIVRPNETFFDLLRKKGFPNRRTRFCCSALKEYNILDTQILGIRASESRKRKERYKEPTACRFFTKKEKVYQIMPILYWTDEDVKEYIVRKKIKVHPVYYDENGKIDVSRRLGCQGCPLMSQRKRVQFFKENPKYLRAWLLAGHEFYKTRTMNEYEIMFGMLFYKNFTEFGDDLNSELYGKADCKKRLEEIFNIDL